MTMREGLAFVSGGLLMACLVAWQSGAQPTGSNTPECVTVQGMVVAGNCVKWVNGTTITDSGAAC